VVACRLTSSLLDCLIIKRTHTLGEIAAALDTGDNEDGVPEWEQFEAIARGEYNESREATQGKNSDR